MAGPGELGVSGGRAERCPCASLRGPAPPAARPQEVPPGARGGRALCQPWLPVREPAAVSILPVLVVTPSLHREEAAIH